VPTPAAPPIPAPTPIPATPGPLFSATSVWNAPLPADAQIDPESAALVQKFRDQVKIDQDAMTGPWIATTQASTPLYVVPASQPNVSVQLHTGWWGDTLQEVLQEVPVPDNAKPAKGSDAHLTVWQPSTDRLWELWHARKLSDGWHADFGGAIQHASTFSGYYDANAWPGKSDAHWGATATSLPVIAGTMRISELQGGVIPHALALNVPRARPGVFSFPAQRTDGNSTDPGAIPEGARFRLDPTLDLSKIAMPRLTRMMAAAAQRYGIIVRDQTGSGLSFFAEDPTQFGTDPYRASGGFFDGKWPYQLMKSFPWDRLQLVKMDLRGR
jgi:hypothetical protein